MEKWWNMHCKDDNKWQFYGIIEYIGGENFNNSIPITCRMKQASVEAGICAHWMGLWTCTGRRPVHEQTTLGCGICSYIEIDFLHQLGNFQDSSIALYDVCLCRGKADTLKLLGREMLGICCLKFIHSQMTDGPMNSPSLLWWKSGRRWEIHADPFRFQILWGQDSWAPLTEPQWPKVASPLALPAVRKVKIWIPKSSRSYELKAKCDEVLWGEEAVCFGTCGSQESSSVLHSAFLRYVGQLLPNAATFQ